jgi:hypothetical protein
VLCALTAAAIAVGSAQTARSNSTNEALTFNGDGVTEEVVKGPGAIDFGEKQPAAMHEGHDLWLSALKQCSEQ